MADGLSATTVSSLASFVSSSPSLQQVYVEDGAHLETRATAAVRRQERAWGRGGERWVRMDMPNISSLPAALNAGVFTVPSPMCLIYAANEINAFS